MPLNSMATLISPFYRWETDTEMVSNLPKVTHLRCMLAKMKMGFKPSDNDGDFQCVLHLPGARPLLDTRPFKGL